MNALALDTSTEILSLCCRTDKGFFEITRRMDLCHDEEIIPLAHWLLEQAQITALELNLVVASGGPGSFTGLRIGMATAQGFAVGAGCALVSVPGLDAYGYSACGHTVMLPVIDAKKKRFYAAFYRGGERLTPYMDASPEEIYAAAEKYADIILTGPHAALFHERAAPPECTHGTMRLDPDAHTGKAAVLLRLGSEAHLRGEGKEAGLMYLREPETT